MTGLVADVGGTNTRLARVGREGVLAASVEKRANDGYSSFEAMAQDYLQNQTAPDQVVVAVAGPVSGNRARLTNRDWDFDRYELADTLGAKEAHFLNDLEALGYAVPGVDPADVEPLSHEARLGKAGQALVVGLGTGFNVSPVDTRSGAVLATEQGHMSLPVTVRDYLATRIPDVSDFDTVENLFAGVGMLRLGRALGLEIKSAADIASSPDPRAQEAIDICTDAFGLMLCELAYAYFPRAGFFFNGSIAKLLFAPERRDRVLAPLRANDRFDGQFARLPSFLFVSDTVALGGCAARLMQLSAQAKKH